MEEYERELRAAVARELERPWERCWPTWSSQNLRIHHSQDGALFSAEDAVEQAELDRNGTTKAICMIENISAEWAVQLGEAWNIPVGFFIEYLKAPHPDLCKRSFIEARLPGSSGGLRSSRGGANWVTMRGIMDFGQRSDDSLEEDADDKSIRLEGHTGPGRLLQHTNISIFSVHNNLDLFLIDKASEAASMFMLKQDSAFPRQTMIRLAFVNWPGHVCVPQLRQPCDSAVLPIWNLLSDEYTAEALMHCLQNNGIDDFMYKAGVFECQRHLNAAMSRIKFISLQDTPHGEETIMRQLRDARQALNRLYRCVEENKSHERAYERSQRAWMPKDSQSNRTHFHQLSKEIRDLEQTVLRDMKVLMMTMNTRDISNNLALTEATHRQSRSMTLLTWLMMVYAPLSCAAGVFGMNLRQLNNSGLEVWWFVGVALVLLGATMAFALTCHCIDRAAHARSRSAFAFVSAFDWVRRLRLTRQKDTISAALFEKSHGRSRSSDSRNSGPSSKLEADDAV